MPSIDWFKAMPYDLYSWPTKPNGLADRWHKSWTQSDFHWKKSWSFHRDWSVESIWKKIAWDPTCSSHQVWSMIRNQSNLIGPLDSSPFRIGARIRWNCARKSQLCGVGRRIARIHVRQLEQSLSNFDEHERQEADNDGKRYWRLIDWLIDQSVQSSLITSNYWLIEFRFSGKYYQNFGELWLDVGAYAEALRYATQAEPYVIGKPSEDYFQTALKTLDAKPEETLMIGDDIESDVHAAQKLGIRGCLVRSGKYRAERDEQHPKFKPFQIVDNLKQIVDQVLNGQIDWFDFNNLNWLKMRFQQQKSESIRSFSWFFIK